MKASVKKTIKFATGACAALGIVTIGAVVASGTAVKVVAEGLKAGTEAMKKTMADLQAEKTEPTATDAQYVVIPMTEKESAPVSDETSPEDFEN